MGLFPLIPTGARTERVRHRDEFRLVRFCGDERVKVVGSISVKLALPRRWRCATRFLTGELPFTLPAPVSRRNTASIFAGSRGGEFGNEGRPRRFALRVGRRFAGREREKVISGVARTLFTCSSSKHLLFATGDKVAYETQYLTSRATEPIVFIIIRGCVCGQA